MKFKFLLTVGLIASVVSADAQNANKGYAITGDGNKDFMWMNIRQIDLSAGQVTKTLFDRSKSNYTITDIISKKTSDQNSGLNSTQSMPSQYPTSTFVAAAAYDKRSDKLFFIPMRMGELRWMDMNIKNETPSFYSMPIPDYSPLASQDEANNITRMVIGADGNGYAVTNDGSHFYRFTTGKKPSITDLGGLIDADDNKGLSVHNKCSSWGGDMIADAYGKVYIISATKNVFTVDVNSRITSFKGTIGGLPASYTTNGAAVDADGNVILCSATSFEGYYKMNIADLAAKKIEGSDIVYNASDLASGNLLFQKEADNAMRNAVVTPVAQTNTITENLVYPNPVVSNSFNVLLDKGMSGNYTVVLTDLSGRALQSNKAGFVKGQQSYRVNLTKRPSKGTYLVKVLDEKGSVVLSDKVIIL